MSVLVECFSVVIKRSVIESRYPGGLAGYQADCPNQTLCADENLVRVGFMVLDDVSEFVLRVLARAGLASTPCGIPDLRVNADSVALVEQGRGPWYPLDCDWLEYAERPDGVCHCWLAESPKGELKTPVGWQPETCRFSKAFYKLEGLPEGKPLSSPEAQVAPAPGYVRLYQGQVFPSKRNN